MSTSSHLQNPSGQLAMHLNWPIAMLEPVRLTCGLEALTCQESRNGTPPVQGSFVRAIPGAELATASATASLALVDGQTASWMVGPHVDLRPGGPRLSAEDDQPMFHDPVHRLLAFGGKVRFTRGIALVDKQDIGMAGI